MLLHRRNAQLDRAARSAGTTWDRVLCSRMIFLIVTFFCSMFICPVTFTHAQTTRQIFSGTTREGLFNLVVNDGGAIGGEAFSLSFYESPSTMQLRRTPYSTVRYTYMGIDAAGTLHLERHYRWQARGIDSVLEVQVKLGTPLAFATDGISPNAVLRFSEGENGVLGVTLVNEDAFERPRNLGF